MRELMTSEQQVQQLIIRNLERNKVRTNKRRKKKEGQHVPAAPMAASYKHPPRNSHDLLPPAPHVPLHRLRAQRPSKHQNRHHTGSVGLEDRVKAAYAGGEDRANVSCVETGRDALVHGHQRIPPRRVVVVVVVVVGAVVEQHWNSVDNLPQTIGPVVHLQWNRPRPEK